MTTSYNSLYQGLASDVDMNPKNRQTTSCTYHQDDSLAPTTKTTVSLRAMDLSVAAVIQSAHWAIVAKNYSGKCDIDPSAIVRLTTRLQKRIRVSIHRTQALQILSDRSVDWSTELFDPIIAECDIFEHLGISDEDAEYLVLLATLLILAYELCLLPRVSRQPHTKTFLVQAFKDYLSEPEVCYRVAGKLNSEYRRLKRAAADMTVVLAVRVLRNLMPDMSTAHAHWESHVPLTSLVDDTAGASQADAADDSDQTVKVMMRRSQLPERYDLSPTFVAFPQDVRVEVYLNPGEALPFDWVESMGIEHKILTVETCIGISILVEPGYTLSETSGIFDELTLSAIDDTAVGLAATIVVPPGYTFRVTEIEDVCEIAGSSGQMMIVTKRGVFIVAQGEYTIERRINRHSAQIVSTDY